MACSQARGTIAASWFSLELTGEQEPAEGIIYFTWPSEASEIPQEALREWCGPGDVWSSQIRVERLPPRACMMQECSSNDVTPDRGFMLLHINKPMSTFLSAICGEGSRTMDVDPPDGWDIWGGSPYMVLHWWLFWNLPASKRMIITCCLMTNSFTRCMFWN